MVVKTDFLNINVCSSKKMKIEFSQTEFRPGTTVRRVYLYEDDGDVIMTDDPIYEDELEDDDGSEIGFDGPCDDDSCV
jgi:hypothetical protein